MNRKQYVSKIILPTTKNTTQHRWDYSSFEVVCAASVEADDHSPTTADNQTSVTQGG